MFSAKSICDFIFKNKFFIGFLYPFCLTKFLVADLVLYSKNLILKSCHIFNLSLVCMTYQEFQSTLDYNFYYLQVQLDLVLVFY